jgi:hypothetical protein
MLDPHLKRLYLQQARALEDEARSLVRRIADALGDAARDELPYVRAKSELLFSAIDELLHLDPTKRSALDTELRALRRNTDELILRRVELDRRTRDSDHRAEELERGAERLVDEARRERDLLGGSI